MKSEAVVKFDYNNAIRQAQKLEELAGRLDTKVVNKMEQTAQEIHTAWAGDSATKYINKEMELKHQAKETSTEIRQIAADIRSIAKRIYNAEMEAVRIARQRTS